MKQLPLFYRCSARYLTTALFFLLMTTAGVSQSPIFKAMVLSPEVEQEQFNCIYQDAAGLIWIGTDEAIYSFDGIDLQKIYPTGQLNAAATALFEDTQGRLWFGFENGMILQYDRYSGYHQVVDAQPDQARITAFLEIDPGVIWAGTYGDGLKVFTPDSCIQINTVTGLSDNYIYSLIGDNKGRIWAGTDNGINICSYDDHNVHVENITVDDGLPDFIVQSLASDQGDHIWIGMNEQGICQYNPENGQFTLPPALANWNFGPITSILPLNNRIWIATASMGIVEYRPDNAELKVYRTCGSQNINRVKAMLNDYEGHVWIVTNTGICRSFGQELEFLNEFGGKALNNIHALTADSQDIIWFGNDEGLHSLDPQNNGAQKVKHYPLQFSTENQKIMSLFRDRFGIIWIGTFGQGIIRFDPKTGQQKYITKKDGLPNENILSIAGSEKEIWLGTLGGALRCALKNDYAVLENIPKFDHFGAGEGLVNNYIYQVYMDETGTPYFATDGNGIFTFRNETFINLVNTPDSIKNVVYSVATDDDGNTWMNVANEGLLKYDGKTLHRITNDPAHKHQTFSGIISNDNELLMVYDNGIDVLNTSTGSNRHFEENAGIENIDPNLNALAIDSEDRIWIGSAKGIIAYTQNKNGVWERPVTILNEVELFLNPIDYRKQNRFGHSENHLTFSFSGLWYQYPEKVDYVFKLEGHDIDWIKTRNKKAIYSDLKPGNYTFRVRAGIYNNFSGSNEISYSFIIKKAFYQSFAFYFLVLLVAIAAITLFVTIRTRQIRRKEEIIQERIRFQFENLKSQLNPHFLFNSFSTLIALIEVDSPQAVKYVEELSFLFRNILDFKDQDLIKLSDEFRIAENYINLQKKRFGESLLINIPDPESVSGLKIPPLTLQLLIENAIKHNVVSKEKPLQIKIYVDHQKACIFVENNVQMKKSDTLSMGIGLDNIISRYKLVSDKNVEVIHDESRFIVSLPFIP